MPNFKNVTPINFREMPDPSSFFDKQAQQANTVNSDMEGIRREIAELRQLLTPSIILTGQRVVDAYQQIAGRG